mmetsp:Transcript_22027/g.47797  ORF Transcript_22027/g.47797 Transcript_22027/m.47797 type:complete len:726 (-) Transcript_22027:56-2233(-)
MKFLVMDSAMLPTLLGAAAATTLFQITPCEAFVIPQPLSMQKSAAWVASSSSAMQQNQQQRHQPSSSTSLYQIGLGPGEEETATAITIKESERIILGEDGLPLPHITNHEPFRTDRLSDSDKLADDWFGALLNSPGPSFLGQISASAKERILQPVALVDEPSFEYGEEEWTPYVTRRLPTSPLYPAYGLETYGLPVPRRGAEAWRHFDVNGLVGVDYSGRPEGIGENKNLSAEEQSDIISSLQSKGAWLDDESCAGRLVYINGRFCPSLSKQTDKVKNLDSSHFADDSKALSDKTLTYLSRLPDGFTDELAAEVPDESKGPLTSLKKLSGPDHNVGEPTSQFAINNQQGTAAFAALNSVKAGCVAYVEAEKDESTSGDDGEEAVLPKPVLLINAKTPSGGSAASDGEKGVAFHPRTLAVANDGSVLSLVQMCVDLNEDSDETPCATFANGFTQVFVGAGANVTHSYLEESGGQVTSKVEMSDEEVSAGKLDESPREVEAKRPALRNTHFEAIDVHVIGDEGSYISSVMELGGTGRSRIGISTTLLRPGAMASINGFALSGGAQRSDMRTNIHHIGQGTVSRQEQRNMVGGRSTASFRGRIRVEQSAQQTDSEQLSRTILLSDHARVWATPSLEIIADDVTCTHGATVSDLSEEELFYLRSRGLDRTTARNMLMYAFVEEIGSSVDTTIAGGFDDKNGLRSRIVRRLENLIPAGEKKLVGGEFQSV